jgi:hypothetical protein
MPSRDSNWSQSDTAVPHSPSPSTESASLGMMITFHKALHGLNEIKSAYHVFCNGIINHQQNQILGSCHHNCQFFMPRLGSLLSYMDLDVEVFAVF